MKTNAKQTGVQLGLMATVLAGAAMAAPEIDVRCLKAAGYYGAVRVKEAGKRVTIDVKSGLAMKPNEFIQKLKIKVEKGHIGYLHFVLPASACEASVENPLEVSCNSREASVQFKVEQGPLHTIRLNGLRFKSTDNAEGTKVRLAALRHEAPDTVSATMQDLFETRLGVAHEGCHTP